MNNRIDSVESLIISDSFQRFCLQPTEEDKTFWKEWLAGHPEQRQNFEEARQWVLAMNQQVSQQDIQAELGKLRQTIQPRTQVAETPVRKMWTGWKVTAVAAAMAILLTLGALFVVNNQSPMQEYATAFGEVRLVDLPDGSILTLNGHSLVRFGKSWDKGSKREIWLEGEGFFEVAHASGQPFVVHTKQGDIKVLGTKFNALQRSEVLKLTLLEGAIEFKPEGKEAVQMEPGEQLQISEEQLTTEVVDTEPVTAWKEGMMIFRNASIQSIIEKLKWDFNWDIDVQEKSILNKHVNAFIQENNPELLLEALAEIYDLTIEQTDKGKYVIK